MEQVIDTYLMPYDPAHPVICFDECGTTLQRHIRPPIVDASGTRNDAEYARNGMAPLNVWVEPHTGRMGVQLSERRTKVAFARAIRTMVAEYPEAEQVTIVLDNLNTHRIGALYHTFPAEEARQLAKRVTFVYTPKRGSWLNMAELAISVFSRAVLHRQRIPDRATLDALVSAWVSRHNRDPHPFDWTWDVDRARTRMPRLYPILEGDK